MFGEVALDGGLQIDQRMETAATDALAGQYREEILDGVQPGAGGRGKMEPLNRPGNPGGASVCGRACAPPCYLMGMR